MASQREYAALQWQLAELVEVARQNPFTSAACIFVITVGEVGPLPPVDTTDLEINARLLCTH